MNYYLQVVVEAMVVGLLTVVVGSIVGIMVAPWFRVDLPQICKTWNQYYVMEISLFLTGVVIHLGAEIFGLNRWYCRNGAACQK